MHLAAGGAKRGERGDDAAWTRERFSLRQWTEAGVARADAKCRAERRRAREKENEFRNGEKNEK